MVLLFRRLAVLTQPYDGAARRTRLAPLLWLGIALSCANSAAHKNPHDTSGADSVPIDTGCEDLDADYFCADQDCDDANATVNPAAIEICDGIDNNCDGLVDDLDPTVTDQTTYYVDNDRDGYGSADETTLTCGEPDGWALSLGDCDDTNAQVNPGQAEIWDGLDNDCEGSVDHMSLANADCVLLGDADGDNAGIAVANLGDVDGDGRSDFLICAPGNDGAGEDAGACYLFYADKLGGLLASGGTTLLSEAADEIFVGAAAADALQVASGADLDGDGLADIILGSPGANRDAGAVDIFLAARLADKSRGTAISVSQSDYHIEGEHESDGLGWLLATIGVGDVDADGSDDILLGVPGFHTSGFYKPGQAYLVFGATLAAQRDLSLTSQAAVLANDNQSSNDEFGIFAGALGDRDGDGNADLVISRIGSSGDVLSYVYSGGSLYAGSSSTMSSAAAYGADGSYLYPAGDLDSDGMVDYDLYTNGSNAIVYADTVLGHTSIGSGDATWTLTGSVGLPLVPVADVNHDAYNELLFGASQDDGAGVDAGAAYLILGRSSDVDVSAADAVFSGVATGDNASYAMAADDLDGDGDSDLLIAAPYSDDYAPTAGAVFSVRNEH